MLRPKSFQTTEKAPEIPAIHFEQCPAKTYLSSDGTIQAGRDVFSHCMIVGMIAKEILNRFPLYAKELFPEGAALVAAAHDVGKVNPDFIAKLVSKMPNHSLAKHKALQGIEWKHEEVYGYHAGLSQIALLGMNVGPKIAQIAGQHHGYSTLLKSFYQPDGPIFGGSLWQQERINLILLLKSTLKLDWPIIDNVAQSCVIAGLTSVADWIGSGEKFEDPTEDYLPLINQALDNAGFIPAKINANLTFEQLFKWPPYAIQQKLIELVDKPGVYILEAPMGIGKTEAALYAAYKILAEGKAQGIYFALPTQLTSNKIYDRFNQFLTAILQDDCIHRKALLLHGSAWLQQQMVDSDIGEEGAAGGSWFAQSKRGLLAPFAVGTLDQALMAAMNVKHGFVRAFGLAGKVVILDEIHTYDAYTGTILDILIERLKALGCTVIILSATLNKDRREQLLNCEVKTQQYPLISALSDDNKLIECSAVIDKQTKVQLTINNNESAAINEAIKRAEMGQQVLWIENTVAQAQERYFDFADHCASNGIDYGLLHSRFTFSDRQTNENLWVSRFGKAGRQQYNEQGRILIGTQVLEQSLDIDADFLVTRFCPTDMLLQRLGRLWRHTNTQRVESASCECWIMAPDLNSAIQNPKKEFGLTASVYSSYILCRSLAVWQSQKLITLPQDIRQFIELTYQSRDESELMAKWLKELDDGSPHRKGRNALKQLARLSVSIAGKTLPDTNAQTRYSDSETVEVLLLRGLKNLPSQKVTQLTLLNGDIVNLSQRRIAKTKLQWRQLAAQLMTQIVTVPIGSAPKQLPIKQLKDYGFHHCFYLGNQYQEEAILRVAIVSDSDDLQGLQKEKISLYKLRYRNDYGYRVIKNKE